MTTEATAPAATAATTTTEPGAASSQLAQPTAPAQEVASGTKEAPATPKSEEQKPPPRSKDWMEVTRAEKQAREAKEALRRERESLAAQRAEFEAQRKVVDEQRKLLERAKSGDWEAREALLKETGVTYDELTKRALGQKKSDPAAEAKAEIEKLKADLARRDEERYSLELAAARRQGMEAFSAVVKSDTEKFGLVALELQRDAKYVEEVIVELAKQRPTLSYEEAAAVYEADLFERAKMFAQTSKVRAAIAQAAPAAEAPKPSTEAAPQAQQEGSSSADGPRTLTNADAAERASPTLDTELAAMSGPQRRKWEEKERERRALAAASRLSS